LFARSRSESRRKFMGDIHFRKLTMATTFARTASKARWPRKGTSPVMPKFS
jgi:hypothetical protein